MSTDGVVGVQSIWRGPVWWRPAGRWEIKLPRLGHNCTVSWFATWYEGFWVSTCHSDANVTCITAMLSCVEQDWSEVVPETVRLDTSAHKAKGLLAQKARRQPPSRTKLKETLTVTASPSKVSQELNGQTPNSVQQTILHCTNRYITARFKPKTQKLNQKI